MKETISLDDVDKYGPQDYRGAFSIPPTELDRVDAVEKADCQLEAHVEKGNLPGEYAVNGTSEVTAALACSRCLDPTLFAHRAPFHVRLRVRPESSEGEEEVEITNQDELDVEYYTEREIPLRDLAIEQIQLSIPMKPLCDDKCLGLCAQCGSNRNREACTCETPVTDDRWGALRGIRDELAKKKES